MTAPILKNTRDEHVIENLKQIQDQLDKRYKYVFELFETKEKTDISILNEIRHIARDMEEHYYLSSPVGTDLRFQISLICSQIIRAFRTRGLTEMQCQYVYDALDDDKYKKYKQIVNHSSSTSLGKPRVLPEQFSIVQSMVEQAVDMLVHLLLNPEFLQRDQCQDNYEKIEWLKEQIEIIYELAGIPLTEIRQKDIQALDDKTRKNPTRYGPTIPAKTQLTEAIQRHIEILILVKKAVYEEGIIDPGTGQQMVTDEEISYMAEGWDVMTELCAPIIDRKWRMDHIHWYKTIKVANTWFKHTASTASKTQAFSGEDRCITREQIGARQQNMPKFFIKTVEKIPHFGRFFEIFMPKIRMPRGADFSTRLSPKLSEASIR